MPARRLLHAAAAAVLLAAGVTPLAHAQTPVPLRAAPIASGAAVTLGDLFEGAGAAAAEPIAPAPPPGQTAPLSARFVAAAVEAAGLSWAPPAGLDRIIVGRAAAGRAASARATTTPSAQSAAAVADAAQTPAVPVAIRKGDVVAIVLDGPGLRIVLQARALADARAGERVRLQNVQSARLIDAVATGPGAAQAASPIS